MKRLTALFGIMIAALFFYGCGSSASSITYNHSEMEPSAHTKTKPINHSDFGMTVDITNDSKYDLDVITLYVSEYGYWHRERNFIVTSGSKDFVTIPSPGYMNWSTCGSGSVTIRVRVNGRIYSSVDKLSICNNFSSVPAYIITDETVERRTQGQGDLWNRPGWGY